MLILPCLPTKSLLVALFVVETIMHTIASTMHLSLLQFFFEWLSVPRWCAGVCPCLAPKGCGWIVAAGCSGEKNRAGTGPIILIILSAFQLFWFMLFDSVNIMYALLLISNCLKKNPVSLFFFSLTFCVIKWCLHSKI